ncbi:hypothetical protein M9Y10_008067 [Tritrichomonas musculus]|uniref:Uncharacterized protein n=1 Tax=Tritrichomonas musculus TaxID=1915356 RepID=A0ABR2IZG3_9EUKA
MTASSLGDSLPTIGSNSAANTTENKPTESQSNSTKGNTDEYEASRSKKVESKDSPDQSANKDHSQTREIIVQPADNMSPNDQTESNSFNSSSLSFVTNKSDKSGTSAFKFGEFDLPHFVKSNKPDLIEPVVQKNESEPSNLPPLDPDEKPISDSKNLKPHPPKSSPGKNKRFHSSPRRIGMFPSLHSKKHGDEEDQSEIAQQQIAQMIEADNKKQKQFNQQMKKQAELMKKMQKKASRSRRKNDE